MIGLYVQYGNRGGGDRLNLVARVGPLFGPRKKGDMV